MQSPHKKILEEVNEYYTGKLRANGTTPQGVDWNGVESQTLRFRILSGIIDPSVPFSVMDYGCGFGSMFDFMRSHYNNFEFTGFDISTEMIDAAIAKFSNEKNARWITGLSPGEKASYVIASGLFNVRLSNNEEEWMQYIIDTMHSFDSHSEKGFSFNCLTKYSDKEYMKDYLYYTDPLLLFDYCKKNFSRNVALLHDYDLYEFTILVRK